MIVDRLSNWRAYGFPPRLARAFELLSDPAVQALPDGRHELDGERLVALAQGYTTKAVADGRLEAHRKYVDVQFVVSGEERMGWAPLEGLPGRFDEEKDLGFYEGEFDLVHVPAGFFAVFFPHDAHAPGLDPKSGFCRVRKIVLKVLAE